MTMRYLRKPLWRSAVVLSVFGWPAALFTLTPGIVVVLLLTGISLGVPFAIAVLASSSASSAAWQATSPDARPSAVPPENSFGSTTVVRISVISAIALVGLAGSWELIGWRTGMAALTLLCLDAGAGWMRWLAQRTPSEHGFRVTDALTPADLELAWESSGASLRQARTVAERLKLVELRALYLSLLLDGPADADAANCTAKGNPSDGTGIAEGRM